MQCSIQGCNKKIYYKTRQLCQMHYFRHMRNGQYELIRHRKKFVVQSSGYIKAYVGGHVLACKDGYVYQHRLVVFDKYGIELPPCELCGALSNWFSRDTHIDHIDCNKKNNAPENLRVLCNRCNVKRTKRTPELEPNAMLLTVDGRSLTATQWAREPNVKVTGATIRRRLKCGFSDFDAIYKEKVTHKHSVPKSSAQK